MPIRADQLQEKKDYQDSILEELRDRNDYIIRNAQTDWSAEYAMDTGFSFGFSMTPSPMRWRSCISFMEIKPKRQSLITSTAKS
jgi:hypothetical protein